MQKKKMAHYTSGCESNKIDIYLRLNCVDRSLLLNEKHLDGNLL